MHQKSFKSKETFEKYARKHLEAFLGVNKTTIALDMYNGTAQYKFITMGSDMAFTSKIPFTDMLSPKVPPSQLPYLEFLVRTPFTCGV